MQTGLTLIPWERSQGIVIRLRKKKGYTRDTHTPGNHFPQTSKDISLFSSPSLHPPMMERGKTLTELNVTIQSSMLGNVEEHTLHTVESIGLDTVI